ncbi:MAG TPA: CPBP family intramembrane glutamic endopeptidase [Rhizomicrobium sp.]|nr:CPBP family intramembrane glutamic endopeptidase [Rhizomicrobium sp.]
MREFLSRISPRTEFAVVVSIAFGLLILSSVAAVLHLGSPVTQHPAHNNRTLIGLMIYEIAAGAVLLPFLNMRGWTARKIGLLPGWRDTATGFGLFVVVYAVWYTIWVTFWMVAPTLEYGIAASTHVVSSGISLLTVGGTSLVNSLFEEVFVCGYIVTALKTGDGDNLLAVNTSVGVRLAYHLYQGATGVINIVPIGLIFAYWYARTGRLWPVVVAHASLDLVGLIPYVKF